MVRGGSFIQFFFGPLPDCASGSAYVRNIAYELIREVPKTI